jgi:hypothetical protein
MKKLLCILLFPTIVSAQRITIVGINCLELVPIDTTVIVCVTPLSEERAYLLKIVDNAQFMEEAYQLLLWRQPDSPGFNYYLNELNLGRKSKTDVINAFVGSAEYKALHP